MKEDRKPLILSPICEQNIPEETKNASTAWKCVKKWTFLIFAVVVGLFDVVTDWHNFVKYVSKPEDLKEFIPLVAAMYFIFCCAVGTTVYVWDSWLALREFNGDFAETILSRDLELRNRVYKEKMYLSLVTILLEDFPCFVLNIFIVYCDSPEDVEQPMFHLASWQTLALASSFVSVVIAVARLIWLNYHYYRVFGCLPKNTTFSACCVWTNTVFAYVALAAMLYFFYGRFVPEIISFSIRQAKVSQERGRKISIVEKNISYEIYDVYRFNNTEKRLGRKFERSVFDGVYSNGVRAMADRGLWITEEKRCSDIFYHGIPRVEVNHLWNDNTGKFDISTTEYHWQQKQENCTAIMNGSGEVLMTNCRPVWFNIEPVWCNFTYRIFYDEKRFATFYNVANMTDKTCQPVRRKWITNVLKEDGSFPGDMSYCEKAARKWKPVWQPELRVC